MNQGEIIQNLFTLHYYWSEIQECLGNKPRTFVIDEYMYDWNIESPNFNIIRSLLMVDEYYSQYFGCNMPISFRHGGSL